MTSCGTEPGPVDIHLCRIIIFCLFAWSAVGCCRDGTAGAVTFEQVGSERRTISA